MESPAEMRRWERTIDANGNYTAPAVLPSPNTITIEAAEASKSSVNASSGITLLNPIPQISGVTPSSVNVGTFTLTISGADFVNRATVSFGGANLSTTLVSSAQLTASGTATSAQLGAVSVTVTNPDPGGTRSNGISAQVVGTVSIASNVADRFLEQTTFGPTPPLITQVQNSGLQGFLTQQYGLPVTPYPTPGPSETDLNLLQQRYFVQALTAPDQLRQRIAFALSQIFVIGGAKISDPTAYTN